MMTKWLVFLGLLFSAGAIAQADDFTIQSSQREMAVTFDDLPFVEGGIDNNWTTLRARADELLRQITANHIPAVGFVNEAKLYRQGQLDEQSVASLGDWLDAGLELGNHTYSHAALSRMPLEQFEQDVIRGETVTSSLLAARGMKLRYFRHPYLQVGNDIATRTAFEKFLAGRGYIIAPVTVNHAEWIFAAAYDRAEQQGDQAALQRVAAAYISYMGKVLANAEQQSMELFGRQIRQVLLLHANSLNADHFGELVAMLKQRGYLFITLADALRDPAYSSVNTYAGTIGVSWLDQWALTVGLTPQKDEAVPVFVKGLAGLPVTAYRGY
ncbi:polysaccharide deacetylase family protein [Sulfuriferula sp. AH1]|uniref:polysaccharide deacetylase family protein n=1 Tax=Sulfuriferula sp. AH1 TaxID=1985873 RepID=UPI001CB97B53|nr:polysaccharide deacetylase family protein [Sulfuriferula sp. AH1]